LLSALVLPSQIPARAEVGHWALRSGGDLSSKGKLLPSGWLVVLEEVGQPSTCPWPDLGQVLLCLQASQDGHRSPVNRIGPTHLLGTGMRTSCHSAVKQPFLVRAQISQPARQHNSFFGAVLSSVRSLCQPRTCPGHSRRASMLEAAVQVVALWLPELTG
jgi:hypothetical protein